jgi:hypothetical protein
MDTLLESVNPVNPIKGLFANLCSLRMVVRTYPSVHFAVSIAVSIAASGCRFRLPFCRAKSQRGMILPD